MCHNAAGAGGALTRGKFAPSLDGVESKHIYEAMETGPQNMPVFNDDNLSPEDKRDVVAYLKAIEENGSPGGISLGSFGPVTEGLYAWTIVLALIIGTTVWLGAKAK
jgi:ubiquinol-cytochrome c reductase cytochrome c subunit